MDYCRIGARVYWGRNVTTLLGFAKRWKTRRSFSGSAPRKPTQCFRFRGDGKSPEHPNAATALRLGFGWSGQVWVTETAVSKRRAA
jgi:hypothetical protein